MALPTISNDTISAASKKNARTRKAQKRRRSLAKTPIHIGGPHELRTLKSSARKQIDRERAPQLWIFPWVDMRHSGRNKGRKYPQASLLGLPTELRQHILHQSYPMEERRTGRQNITKASKRVARQHKRKSSALARSTQKAMLDRVQLEPHQGELTTNLSRRIGELSRVSPLIRQEMNYVSKRWQTDLEEYLDQQLQFRLHAPKLPVVAEGYEWLFASDVGQPTLRRNKGKIIKAKKLLSGKRVRPPKCWYCTERHLDGDLVCPMARRDPEKWQQMTKKVGGWRGKPKVRPTFKGEKVLFDS